MMHIYGPFSIHAYGVCIVIGVLAAFFCMQYDKRYYMYDLQTRLPDIISALIIGGIMGGRLLFYLAEDHHIYSLRSFFAVWEGGFSLLGTVIAVITLIPLVARWYAIRPLFLSDFLCTYAPLIQGISRIGCFFAGCCYGRVVSGSFEQATMPSFFCDVSIDGLCRYPCQLLSAITFIFFFLILFFYLKNSIKKPGQITLVCLMLFCIERFLLGFLRGDTVLMRYITWQGNRYMLPCAMSVYQLIAFVLIGITLIVYWYISRKAESINGK